MAAAFTIYMQMQYSNCCSFYHIPTICERSTRRHPGPWTLHTDDNFLAIQPDGISTDSSFVAIVHHFQQKFIPFDSPSSHFHANDSRQSHPSFFVFQFFPNIFSKFVVVRISFEPCLFSVFFPHYGALISQRVHILFSSSFPLPSARREWRAHASGYMLVLVVTAVVQQFASGVSSLTCRAHWITVRH